MFLHWGRSYEGCSEEETPPPKNSPPFVMAGAGTPLVWRFALAVVIAIAVFTALYLARTLLLPVALAFLLSALLSPIVRFLREFGLPEVLGAATVMVLLIGAVVALGSALWTPALEWFSRLPEVLAQLQTKLEHIIEALRQVSAATGEVDRINSGNTGTWAFQRPSGLREFILGQTWQILGGTVVMLFLLFFLLASGNLFLRRLVQVLPSFREKRLAVLVAREIQHDVSRYLFTIAVINSVLGTLVALAMYLLKMPNPLLWGVLAGVLNFIPYLGPFVTLIILTSVALLTFESLGQALLRPAVFFTMTTLEGQLITPLVLGRRLVLNPVVVFLSLIFWAWLWGIVGALIAVPLTMVIKILCDAVPPLRPVSLFMAR